MTPVMSREAFDVRASDVADLPAGITSPEEFNAPDDTATFASRHIGITPHDEVRMLSVIGAASCRALIDAVLPSDIARRSPMRLPPALSEAEVLAELKSMAGRNRVLKSFICRGYHGTHTPTVILRNVLENPAWYTAYTPYQTEISQGRLEALLDLQTMVCDLTGMAVAGTSMLDEATAAAEAMTLALRVGKKARASTGDADIFFIADDVLPQVIDVLRTRARPLGFRLVVGSLDKAATAGAFAVLLPYPGVTGAIHDLRPIIDAAHAVGSVAIVNADLLALTLLVLPPECGADIVVGITQRFGMPMGNSGQHAAYLATRDEFKRSMPGRLAGTSIDAHGATAYRLALQTCEQHIRREKATSNFCTAQVLPVVVATLYAVWHGPEAMKLNATSEMILVTWPEFADIHPFVPINQRAGCDLLRRQLEGWLCEATGYQGANLQPNAGSQGEYAGLLAIQAWHRARSDAYRTICLIPESAHGTNPASAQMAGSQVVVTRCDACDNIDLDDLRAKRIGRHHRLAAIMITYPSIHGVFDPQVREICALVHQHGGLVCVDGANMSALVGVAAPGKFGGDVSHLDLHKTFCILHGGGGPEVDSVRVVADLMPFLPSHAVDRANVSTEPGTDDTPPVGAISAAPLGNALVLPISWMHMRMMGSDGLTAAIDTAILSTNYIAARLAPYYLIHFSGRVEDIAGHGVANECILDLPPLNEATGGYHGIGAEDVAERLIDYGFHAPTLSFPVAGTPMVEPTKSESLAKLERFCDAMIAIRAEISKVESGFWPYDDNPLRAAPLASSGNMLTRETKQPTRSKTAVTLNPGPRWAGSTTSTTIAI